MIPQMFTYSEETRLCDNCPREVEWRQISFQPLVKIIRSMTIRPCCKTRIPRHLAQEGIRESQVIMEYCSDATPEQLESALIDSKLSWDAINYNQRKVCAGSAFKLPQRKGYWALHAPCLECYGRLIDQDTDALNRCVVLVSLDLQK